MIDTEGNLIEDNIYKLLKTQQQDKRKHIHTNLPSKGELYEQPNTNYQLSNQVLTNNNTKEAGHRNFLLRMRSKSLPNRSQKIHQYYKRTSKKNHTTQTFNSIQPKHLWSKTRLTQHIKGSLNYTTQHCIPCLSAPNTTTTKETHFHTFTPQCQLTNSNLSQLTHKFYTTELQIPKELIPQIPTWYHSSHPPDHPPIQTATSPYQLQ